jgi:hypothetical protein
LRLEAFPFADFTRHEYVGEKLHLDFHFPFTFTRFAPTAGHVE